MKRFLVMVTVGAGMLACVSGAQAASLVYLNQAGDVAAARPDGSSTRKLVSNGFEKNALSVDGDGRIAYFSDREGIGSHHDLINREGRHLAGPFVFGSMGICSAIPPYRSAFSPDGTWLAVTYVHGNACNSAVFTPTVRLVDSDGPTLDGSIYGSYEYLREPRFLQQNQPLLSGIISNQVNVWQSPDTPSMMPWISLDDPNWDIDSFDYDPTRNRMIMEQSPAGIPAGGERLDFVLIDFDSPGGSDLQTVCTYDGLVASSTTPARPRYSPDGKLIAWNGPAGIHVSPAPGNNGGTCTLSPKLVIPGGDNVEWAPFDLGTPSTGGKVQVIGVSGTSRAGFRKGSTVKVKVPSAGLVKVAATVSKSTAKALKLVRRPRGAVKVASGSRKAIEAGTVSVKLNPTARLKRAWKKLAGVKVTIRATQGGSSATQTVKLRR